MNSQSNGFKNLLEIFLVSLRLGLTSFGGPIAHIGYFQEEYVNRRKWLNNKMYADLVALCQFLPGPASSQIGMSIGILRGGLLGGVISWFGFTFPSVLLLMLFAIFVQGFSSEISGLIQGLKIVAVVVVSHALSGMTVSLTPDRIRITIAVISAVFILLFPSFWIQLVVILIAGLSGLILFKNNNEQQSDDAIFEVKKSTGVISFVLFIGLIVLLPTIRYLIPGVNVTLIDIFYRVGSIVYGGGHVVLPLLEREVVPIGLISAESFLAGYGAAQAVPGPMFTLSAYVGTVANGVMGGIIATIFIFLPSFLLVVGVLPFWNGIRKNKRFRSALMGVNAAVVGLLLAALYDPIFTSAIKEPIDFCLALIGFILLKFWKMPAWFIVLLMGLIGQIIYL